MSKILNAEGRVFGCLSAAEQQELKDAARTPGAVVAVWLDGGWATDSNPFVGDAFAYRVTLPAAPVTCPVCGSPLFKQVGSSHYHCTNNYNHWYQTDANQRPKRPEPREGYHAGECRLPKKGDMYYHESDGYLLKAMQHHDSPMDRPKWIAVPDAAHTKPPRLQALFDLMHDEHGLTLVQNELAEIERAVMAAQCPAPDHPDHIVDANKMVAPAPEPASDKSTYPAQCECGHMYLEKYQFNAPLPSGVIGFCWCGFCRTRRNVYAPATTDPLDKTCASEEYLNDPGRDAPEPVPANLCDSCEKNMRGCIPSPAPHYACGFYARKSPEPVPVVGEVLAELERAMRKFPQWPTDPIHAACVIAEECGELQKAVLEAVYEPHKGSRPNIRTEAVQTAAMCLRFIESLDAYEWYHAKQHKQKGINAKGAV